MMSDHRSLQAAVRRALNRYRGPLRALSAVSLSMTAAMPVLVSAAELPVPCIANNCGANVSGFVTQGAATFNASGNTMNINQTSANATLNWRSFNISADGIVNFQQPDASSVALNRIFQGEPSKIFGALNANGRVYLLNQNGIMFKQGAKVNVGALIASSLNITQEAIDNGILGAAAKAQREAFELFNRESPTAAADTGNVEVDPGAVIKTPSGGQVFLFAPNVVNRGSIVTPDGQTILAGGQSVFLVASGESELRGVLVEVGVGGTVTNGETENATRDVNAMVGDIIAERGNVTLAGLAVNQLGRVSATTSVRANGSIRLQARSGGSVEGSNGTLVVSQGGTLTLGERSRTMVTLEDSDETAVDVSEQLKSEVKLDGHRVNLLSDSVVAATGGSIAITASKGIERINTESPNAGEFPVPPDDSRVYIAPRVTLDVSGASTEVAMERNSLRVELRGSQLSDSPEQRDSPLRGQPVFVDVRASGTRADGTKWQGTPLADVSGNIAGIGRDVKERNSMGGTIAIASHGDVIVAPQASFDLSGGAVTYRDGFVNVSQLLGADGKIYSMENADRDRQYSQVASVFTLQDRRWGISETYSSIGVGSPAARFEQGYVEGKDAGTLKVIAPSAVLDGNVKANVIAGTHQRQPTAPLTTGQIFRPYNQVPLGASLRIGVDGGESETPNLIATNVTFDRSLVSPTLGEDGAAFDPLTDALPDTVGVNVQSQWLGRDRFANVSISANDTVTVPEDVSLALPAGGTLNIEAAHVSILGDIDAPSGIVAAHARQTITEQVRNGAVPDLLLGENSEITARGSWINDSLLLNPDGATSPLWINGGSVELSVEQGGLVAEVGSIIDVSAGAWRKASGTIVAGAGGSIALSASSPISLTPEPPRPVPFVFGSQVYAYALERGGTLSLEANEICLSVIQCNDALGTLWLTPERFESGGFGAFSLTANLRGLSIAPGTQVRLRQQNLELMGDVASFATGTSFSDITRITYLPDEVRRATDLSLRVATDVGTDGFRATDYTKQPDLTVGLGAVVLADPGASLSLRSNTRMIVEGTLQARGGDISLTLDNTLARTGYFASQGIWLTPNARLDVSGVARVIEDDIGRITGDVLDGGSVNINAQRGYVLTSTGSTIDVSGTSADIDVRTSATQYQRRTVTSAGGSVSIKTAEGAVLAGTMIAGGGSATDYAGDFSLTLDTSPRGDRSVVAPPFPLNAREITLTDTLSPLAAGPGAELPLSLNGQAMVAADALDQAGFDSVSLTARNLVTTRTAEVGPELVEFGRINIDAGVNFDTRARLVLDAASIALDSGDAILSSSYVSIGNSDTTTFGQQVPTVPSGDGGTLTLRGGMVDVIGDVSVLGANTLKLDSSGDIRLRGVVESAASDKRYSGSLTAARNIELHAAQIYPTTLTDFTLAASDAELGTIKTFNQGTRTPVLSAAGRVTLLAHTIDHGGTLVAPHGAIELGTQARPVTQLTARAGSLLSTVADTTIPFGTTQGGFDWTYGINTQTVVVGANGIPVPERSVSLNAQELDFGAGAKIDVSAGGDLQAYEWVPGVGGSADVLDASVSPNQFAILPGLGLNYAPHNGGADYQNAALRPGDSVYLSGVPGLPDGNYTLMPARYALLPGAFLVTAVDGYQDLGVGEIMSQLNGATVASGYRTIAGTGIRDARTSGFLVRPGSDARKLAQYDVTFARDFFSTQAIEKDLPIPRLADDAGRIAFIAGSRLNLAGTVVGNAPEGRGAAVDISGSQLAIVNDTTQGPTDSVSLSAAQLSALNAESLLIGGQRTTVAEGTQVAVSANTVIIGDDVKLQAPEVILAAVDTVSVGDRASIVAQGEAADASETLLLQGDSALLRVSAGNQVEVKRSGASRVTGTLDVAATSMLSAVGGSVTADASLDTLSFGGLNVKDGSLSLGASRISFGQVGSGTAGLVLDAAQLATLGLKELVLNSRSSFDFYGNASLSASNLVLNGGGLIAASAGTAATINADTLTLKNGSAIAAPTASGSGTLTVSADELRLDEGNVALAGFSSANLRAESQIATVDSGKLTSNGNLTLTAGRIVGGAGESYEFNSQGVLNLASIAGASGPTAAAPLGAKLQFTGNSVTSTGNIVTPSGIVELRATGTGGDVSVQGGTINVAGSISKFDGVDVAADAGRIVLASASGDVDIANGATLNLNAAGEGHAGRLTLTAENGSASVNGSLLGAASSIEKSGEFRMDAQSLGDLNALNEILTAGGFHSERSLRQRGAGDINIASTWRVHELNLTADQGSIRVTGTIDGSGEEGGSAVLSARNNVVIDGKLDFSSSGAGKDGGTVELRSTNGGVFLNNGSSIDLTADDAGAAGGTLHLRASRAAVKSVSNDVAGDEMLRLAGSVQGARSVTLEGFQTYTADDLDRAHLDRDDLDGFLSGATIYADAVTFMTEASSALTKLGHGGDSVYRIVPGVEVQVTANMLLDQNVDLSPSRFGANLPGILTVRAAGNLDFKAALSDGFSGLGAALLPQGRESWSYRLVAGSDLNSADVMAVKAGTGSLTVTSSDSGRGMIRTGTGSIDIAAAGNVSLVDQRSVIYTAGAAGPGVPLPLRTQSGGIGGLAYPEKGGGIDIFAGGDVVGAISNQLFTSWLWRTGSTSDASQPNATAWTISFDHFQQNIGALGGGDVAVEARGNIKDLSVSAPSIGRQVRGTSPDNSEVEVVGGGDINVDAGGSLLGGTYYAGLGSARLHADDAVSKSTLGARLAPVLALGDAAIAVTARTGVAIETAINPTLLPQATAQLTNRTFGSYFSTYSPDASVDLASAAGDVQFGTVPRGTGSVGTGTLSSAFSGLNSINFPGNDITLASLSIYPPNLSAAALGGDLRVASSMYLYPSAQGDLNLFADGNAAFNPVAGTSAADLVLSDADFNLLPGPGAPSRQFIPFSTLPTAHAEIPVHGRNDDEEPVRIVARRGNISAPSSINPTMTFAKPARVVAGQDIVDLPVFQGQNLDADDVTSLIAGRDIRYSLSREENGIIRVSDREVVLGGPGRLEIQAGRNVDLQTSKGITTVGSTSNPALSKTGASIDVVAGLNAAGIKIDQFTNDYIEAVDTYDAALIAYMEQRLKKSGIDKTEALSAFRELSPSEQLGLIETIFFSELRASGRYAAQPDPKANGDFSQGFKAIESLFPGSNPDLEAGETNPYAGAIRLYFSKIYTLFGGDINLIAPGGEVNVGLASPPSSFGVRKAPSDLGVVVRQTGNVSAYTYDDLQVNESRVFSADGGDILVWSTQGDIDAGRGAKTAISAPPPVITVNPNGQIEVQFSAALTGSGVQTLATSKGVKPGNVDLFAPRGVVNAGDAGIVAGNLTIAATAVLGADNIQVSGVAVGVPVDTGGLGASLSSVSSAASGAASAASAGLEPSSTQKTEPTSADAALSWLDVFVVGLGEEQCAQTDLECLKRQKVD